MIGFQILFIPLLCLLVCWELFQLWKPHARKLFRLIRAAVWIMAAVLIYQPDLTSVWANRLGIQRGADLVIYLFMIVTPLAFFHLYAKQFALQRTLVLLVRQNALQNAVTGQGLTANLSETNAS